MSRRAFAFGGSALAILAQSGCAPVIEHYRFKLVLEVEVGGRRFVGQGVREFIRREQSAFPDQSNLLIGETRGEAFWIDIPQLPTIYVIIPAYNGTLTEDWDPDKFLIKTDIVLDGSEPKRVEFNIGHADVPIDQLPAFVYFDGPGGRLSAEVLEAKDFSKVFGAGAHVVRAEIMRTAEPVSRGIKKKLPWLAEEIQKEKKMDFGIEDLGKYHFRISHFYYY